MRTSARRRPQIEERSVAPGVYRFGSERVNWYLVEVGDELVVVDAGLPGHWSQLVEGVDALGHKLDDVAALVLTHAHVDHVGFAERLRTATAVPVFVHEADAPLARGTDDAEAGPGTATILNAWRPAVLGLLVEFVRGGALSVPPIAVVEGVDDGDVLDVPGSPELLHVPGHSTGSCAIYFPESNVLFSGDALVTRDVLRGRPMEPGRNTLFDADEELALASLETLTEIGRVRMLPGHGDPWEGELSRAVASARGEPDS